MAMIKHTFSLDINLKNVSTINKRFKTLTDLTEYTTSLSIFLKEHSNIDDKILFLIINGNSRDAADGIDELLAYETGNRLLRFSTISDLYFDPRFVNILWSVYND